HRLHRERLIEIVHRCGRAMCVDVFDILRLDACILQRGTHGELSTGSFGRRRRQVMRVGTLTETGHFTMDLSAARPRMLQLLEHDDTRPFAEDETVPRSVERPACRLW